MEHKMFCYQCQETAGCSGCTQMGVCGKKPEVAAMQDLLIYVSKGLSAVTTQLRKEGTKVSEETNHLITWNLFTTITNANFDNEAIIARIHNTLSVRRTLILQVKDTSGLPEAAFWDIKTKDGSDASDDVLFAKAKEAGVLSTKDEDIRSLRELITYGLKGLSAYSKHANVLLSDDPEIDAFLQRALAATLDDSLTADDLIALTLETGNYGVRGMAMLDTANTGAYGNPEITRVNIGVGKIREFLSPVMIKRSGNASGTDTGNRCRCVYTLRNASCPLLPGIQKISELCRKLRKCMVETKRRI